MTTKEQAAAIEAVRRAIRAEVAPIAARIDQLLAQHGQRGPAR